MTRSINMWRGNGRPDRICPPSIKTRIRWLLTSTVLYEGTAKGDDTHYDDYHAYRPGEQKTEDSIYDNDEYH